MKRRRFFVSFKGLLIQRNSSFLKPIDLIYWKCSLNKFLNWLPTHLLTAFPYQESKAIQFPSAWQLKIVCVADICGLLIAQLSTIFQDNGAACYFEFLSELRHFSLVFYLQFFIPDNICYKNKHFQNCLCMYYLCKFYVVVNGHL